MNLVQQILEELYRKTVNFQVDWNASGVTDQFIVKLAHGSVLLDKYPDEDEPDEFFYYSLVIHDEEFKEVDSVYSGVQGDTFNALHGLFELVKRRIRKTDERLLLIIKDLSGEDAESTK